MIAVIGDLHIGASLKAGTYDAVTGMYSRLTDYENTLIFTIDDLIKRGVKTIIFTGDVFEHRHPTMSQQKIFSHALQHAIANGIDKIYIIVGNHDQQRIRNTTTLAYLSELKLPNIVVVDEICAAQEGGDMYYFVPYRDRRQLQLNTYDEAIDKMRSDLTAVRKANTCTGSHIVVGHMAIEGTFFAEEDTELYTDNDLMLPKEMFRDFDLTIMGHVHTPGMISKDPLIYYVGSMEKRAAHENHDKQYLVIDQKNRTIEWLKEPCKDFWEVDLNMTDAVHGPNLMPVMLQKAHKALSEIAVEGNIIKILMKIMIDDIGFLDLATLRTEIAKYKPSFVYPITPSTVSQRTSTKVAVEAPSDADTWVNYCKSLPKNQFSTDIVNLGLDLISEGAE